jgi:dolichyl-phosphate beta-glucosyltransferase
MEISVIIPAFDEEAVIEDTVREIKDFLTARFSKFEIIIVDDASRDRTLKIANQIKNIRVLRNLTNHGKGYTVAKGVRAAKGEMILFMDADNSTPIKELEAMLPYIQDYHLVIGSRALSDSVIVKQQAAIKVWLGRSGNLLIRLFLLPGIKDTQCGFKLFRKEVKSLFEKLTINKWGFDFELLFLARRQNFKIKEVPITWTNNEQSKVTPIGYLKTLAQVFKVRANYLFKKYK